jgi:hypothetical protein
MSLSATVVSLSQDMDLETGAMAHFLVLRLPNGKSVRALITDEGAHEIVQLFVQSGGASVSAETPIAFTEGELRPESEGFVFGGSMLAPEPAPPSPPPTPRAARIRHVPKDEMGYPIVPQPSMRAAGGGGAASDEDGVDQV